MADFIKLNDGSVYEIEGGASIDNIIIDAVDNGTGLTIASKFTAANVSHIEFYSSLESVEAVAEASPSGEYDNLAINYCYYNVSSSQVLVSLRAKTDIELRLDAIEEEQEEQNDAIDYLAMES